MMAPVHRVHAKNADPFIGHVRIDTAKLFWNGIMICGAVSVPFFVNLPAIILFLLTTYLTLLFGHSVGMHRMMIHRSADANTFVEKTFILLGTWVGIGGPGQIITVHDTRDWAQRQPHCHDFFAHRRGYLRDISWQLFYKFEFVEPPKILIEPRYSDDGFYRHLSRYWRWHQLALAAFLFMIGGLPFVLWGVCARVALSTIGHWSVTYICHNPGPGRYDVAGAGVQASDLRGHIAGVLTHGECWHSNHHAFPESARIGLYAGQPDPAGRIIEWLCEIGLVSRIGTARALESRDDLLPRSN